MVKRLEEWVLKYKKADCEPASEPHPALEPNNERWSVSILDMPKIQPWAPWWSPIDKLLHSCWIFSLFIQESPSHFITFWEWQNFRVYDSSLQVTQSREYYICLHLKARETGSFIHATGRQKQGFCTQNPQLWIPASLLTAIQPKSPVWVYEDIEDIGFAFKELALY